jgi:methyl-accepting chemotaxis protein
MSPAIFTELPSFLDIGAWTIVHIKPLFQSFKNEDVAPALALLVFSVALALCVLFLIESIFIRAQIWRRLKVVRNVKTKAEFSAAIPKIENLMLKSRYLRHSWQKFRETLIENSEHQEILNTARPQIYFNTVEAGLGFPFYRAMPNLLVGIGLLLTFFGLVSALYFATDAINNARDLAASQQALKDLLYAASFKFYTSIAGLAGSIIMTLVLRYGTSKIDAIFDALAWALESKLVFVTPESIAFDHYREAQEQTRNLKLFNTEVAVSIGRHVEEALAATLPNQLAQAMAPITESLNAVANKLTSMNEGAIGELAGKFATKLEGTTGEHLQALATTLGSLSTSLEQLNRHLAESGSGLVRNVSDSSQEIRSVVDAMANTARSIQEAGAPIAESSRLLTDASQRIADATRNTEQIIVGAQNEIREIGTLLRTTLETTAKQWEDYEKRFKDVDESLSAVLDQITRTVQSNVESMGEFVKKIDEKFSGAIDKLGGGIDELNEFAQSIEQTTSKLNDGIARAVP